MWQELIGVFFMPVGRIKKKLESGLRGEDEGSVHQKIRPCFGLWPCLTSTIMFTNLYSDRNLSLREREQLRDQEPSGCIIWEKEKCPWHHLYFPRCQGQPRSSPPPALLAICTVFPTDNSDACHCNSCPHQPQWFPYLRLSLSSHHMEEFC